MKKRILSLVLALLMLLSVLPTTALAAEGGTETPTTTGHTSVVSAESDDKAVHVIKSVDGDTLTLEAYATNSVSTKTSYEPLDIVLVLDVSGSMDYCVNCGAKSWGENDTCGKKPESEYPPKGKAKDLTDKDGTLYVYNVKNRKYKEVQWCDGRHFGWSHAPGWYDGDNRIGDETTLYQKVTPEGKKHQHRIDALKAAVNTFIDSVAKQKDSDGNAIDNRISLVKFAGDKTDKIGNNTYDVTTGFWALEETNTYNHTQIVKELTRVDEAGKTALTNAVNALKATGATSADYGMELAKKALEKRTGDAAKRKSVVIMFTDGEPNHGSGFVDTVANSAIDKAKTLKKDGTLVYTIGMFTGADPALKPEDRNTSNTNKYMHAVSSNYPKATTYTSLGDRAENSNYYLAASSSSQLSAIFQAISEDISSLKVKVDASSVLSDTLSQFFTFDIPEDAENSGIEVYEQPVKADGTDDVENRKKLTKETDGVEVKVDGKTLEVKGFDYGENAVTTKTEGEEVIYSGSKLVVTIPIKPDTGYTGWTAGTHYYNTNAAGAGLTYGEEGNRQKVELTGSPEAPVTAYTVNYSYTGDVPTDAEEPKDGTAYIAGQEATVADAPTSVTQDGYTYTFGGWTSSDTISDGKILITDHDVTVTGNWTKEKAKPEQKYIKIQIRKDWKNFPANGCHNALIELYADNNKVEDHSYSVVKYGGETNQDFPQSDGSAWERQMPVYDNDGNEIVYSVVEKLDNQTFDANKTLTTEDGTWSYKVDKAVADNGDITFTVTNTYTAKEEPGLSITKTAKLNSLDIEEDDVAKVGDTLYYTITVTNTGNTTLENITIEDEFNGKGTLYRYAGYGNYEQVTLGENGKFTVAENVTLAQGSDPVNYQFRYIVTLADAKDNDKIKNTAVAKVGDKEMDRDWSEIDVDNENFDLTVKKYWGHKDGELAPTDDTVVTVALLADGTQKQTGTITMNGSQSYTFTNLPLWKIATDGEGNPIITDPENPTTEFVPIKYTVEEIGISYGDQPLKKVEDEDEVKFEVKDANNNLLGYWVATYPESSGNELQIKNIFEGLEQVNSYTVTKKILVNDEPTTETEADFGDEIIFAVTITNTGTRTLQRIELTENFNGHDTLDGVYTNLNDPETKTALSGNKVALPDILPGASVTYYLKYTVHDDDGDLVNEVEVKANDDHVSSNKVYVYVDRGDVDGYKVQGYVTKTVRSDKGTYEPDDTEFEFVITDKENNGEVLKRFWIPFTDTVKEGKEETTDREYFSFELSENKFEALPEEETIGFMTYKIVYLAEVAGDDPKMTYSTTPIKLYIPWRGLPQIAMFSGLTGEVTPVYAYVDPTDGEDGITANVTNIYNKKYEKPVKVGPQLNRDDHVAYIMGYPDGTVQPEGEITRAEACTIFFRLLTDSSRDYYFSKTNDYSDVNAGDWFNNAISTLSNAGIVTGYNDGTFRPNQPITRGEMAKIIANFANLKHGDKTFTDLAGHWSKSYVELAAGNGWIAGYPDGSFRPDQKITRAETVTMINRVLERVPAKESRLLSRSIMLTFPDNNPGDWYYIAIQEASNSHEYQRSVYETTGDEMWTKLIDNVDWTKLEK